MRSFDWTGSPLGPVEAWPPALRSCVRIIATAPQPMSVWWGDALIALHNDACEAIVERANPGALGRPAAVVWRAIWDELGPHAERALRTGHGAATDAVRLMVTQDGVSDELYCTFACAPVRDDRGDPGGVICTIADDTQRVVGGRRLALLRALAARTADAPDLDSALCSVEEVLATDPQDLPGAAIYLECDRARVLERRGTIGDGARAALAPPRIALDEPASAPFRAAFDHRARVVTAAGGPSSRRRLAVWPIAHHRRPGLLVVGLGPAARVDEAYADFLSLVSRQLAASIGDADAGPRRRATAGRASPAEGRDAQSIAGFRILVVEDDPDMCRAIAELLGQHGATVQAARDGVQALAVCAEAAPDLIVTDLAMPDLDGLGLLATLRAREDGRDIPVIVLSARGDPASRVASFEAGADDYLIKPFAPRELVARAAVHLQLTRLRREATLASEHLRALFMGAPIAIAVVRGPEHRYELANQRYLELIDRRDVVGKRMLEDVFPEVTGPERDLPDRVCRTGEPFVAEEFPARIRRRGRLEDGYFHFVLAPTRDAAGSVTGMMVVAVEVTEQVRARRALADSEQKFRRIFEANTIGLAVGTLDGRLLDANDYHLGLLQIRREDVQKGAARWDSVIPPEHREAVRASLEQLHTTGICPPFELECLRADGTRVPVVAGAAKLPGRDDAAISFMLDNTARKRVEHQLAFVADATTLLAGSHDEGAMLEAIAAHATTMLGDWCGVWMTRDDGLALVASHHRDPDRRAELEARAAAAAVRETVAEVARDGRSRLTELEEAAGVRAQLVVPVAAHGEVMGALGFAVSDPRRRLDDRDRAVAEELGRRVALAIQTVRLHHERATLLARERELRAQAEDANRAKDEFLAMLGHELRNPLAPIATALELVRRRGAPELSREHEVLERQLQHLGRLVDDLLDVSRITRGKIALELRRVELAEIVAEALELAGPLIEQRRHQLAVRVPPSGVSLDADPIRLAQVVANLLTNAAKYTEPGGRITIDAERSGAEVELRVRDTGVGIAADMLPRIFDMFVQGRQAPNRAGGGLGLGLTIVRSLVELHGGTVEARSEGRGRGSELVLRLPASVAPDPPPTATGETSVRNAPSDGRRILVVDDNEDAADLLADVLRGLGNETRIAHDAAAALDIVEEFVPDVALIDIGLPVIDGYALARRLRERAGLADTRLVAVTGYGQESDKRRSREAGFDAHLVKPVNTARLRETLDEVCGRS